MKKHIKLLSLVMALIFALAMTACGAKDAQTEEPAPEEEAYDICTGLTETVNDDGSKTVETEYFTLTLPLGDTWAYEQDSETSITFYNIAGREADCGGRLMSLILYNPTDMSYNELPHACVAGETIDGIYIAEFPSDVQADIEDEQHMEEYQTVYAEVAKIEEQATNSQTDAVSPLVLK